MTNRQTTGTLAGIYTMRNDGRQYTYFAAWTRTGNAVEWDGNIQRGERAATELEGVVDPVEPETEDWNVRHALEVAIETGAEFEDE